MTKTTLTSSLRCPRSRRSEPESRAANRELGERLKDAVAALPAAQRDAFCCSRKGD